MQMNPEPQYNEFHVRSVAPLEGFEHRSREQLRASGIRGLQCGAGADFKAGCLNVDAAQLVDTKGHEAMWGRVSICDDAYFYLRQNPQDRFPLDDACAEWVYSEHFIEHLDPKHAIAWLAELRRLLEPGGFIRLSTPDLTRYLTAYSAVDSSAFFELHRERLRAIGMPHPANRRAWMVNQVFYFWGHRWLYDFEELTYAAAAAGFPSECVAEVGFRKGRLREVAAFDQDVRNDESLYVEITKPAN